MRLLRALLERIEFLLPYSRHQSRVQYLQIWGHVNAETEVTTEALLELRAQLAILSARVTQLERRNHI